MPGWPGTVMLIILVVAAQTVQATEQAVNTVFGGGGVFDFRQLGCDWKLISESEVQK